MRPEHIFLTLVGRLVAVVVAGAAARYLGHGTPVIEAETVKRCP
jgi:hypothetical protein